MLDCGYRINELANLDVGSFRFDDASGAWLDLPSLDEGHKTGPRSVYAARSAGLAYAYLSGHTDRTNPDAPLLPAYDFRRKLRSGRRLGKQGIWSTLSRLQARADVRHFRPHDLRPTAVRRTHQAGLNQVDLSERFWGRKDNKHAARYVHNSDMHRERLARKAAGIDQRGLPQASRDETREKLNQLRRLWEELMGTELPERQRSEASPSGTLGSSTTRSQSRHSPHGQ